MKKVSFVLGIILIMAFVGCAAAPVQRVQIPPPGTPLVAAFPLGAFNPVIPGTTQRNIRGRNAISYEAMAVASRYDVSQVGAYILRQGGTAIDAAVAMGFAISVVETWSNGIGGGGFATVRYYDGRTFFLDFRETAPAAAHTHMYVNPDGTQATNASLGLFPGAPNTNAISQGALAVAIPHEVAGLLYLLENFGTMTREQVITPALRMAAEGFEVTTFASTQMNLGAIINNQFTPENVQMFIDPETGLGWMPGSIINNPGKARVLQYIIDYGNAGFYQGPVAEAIIATVSRLGGILTMEDLQNVQPRVFEPVRGTYRGFHIITSAPPSSGGTTLMLIMNMLEHFDLASMPINSVEWIHTWVEVYKQAFAHRAEFVADTRFFNVPIAGYTSKDFAAYLVSRITPGVAQAHVLPTDFLTITPTDKIPVTWPRRTSYVPEASPLLAQAAPVTNDWSIDIDTGIDGSTTHISVADRFGNKVAMTKTLNSFWGSQVFVDGFGFALNNEMASGFIWNPGGPVIAGVVPPIPPVGGEPVVEVHIQAPRPGMAPVSSMSPTIVLTPEGEPFLILGTPGALHIIQTTAQVISKVIDHNMTLEDAISSPKVYNVSPLEMTQFSVILPGMERFALSEVDRARLMAMGHRDPFTAPLAGGGVTQAIMFRDGRIYGMADPRQDGRAVGF